MSFDAGGTSNIGGSSFAPRRWPGVGTGPFTRDKLAGVDGWLDILTKMTRGILHKNSYAPRQYTVIDLNAGPGRYLLPDGDIVDGTPLLVLRRLAISQLQWRAVFVERNALMAKHLRYWLDQEAARLTIDSKCFCVVEGDNQQVVLPWVARCVPPKYGAGIVIHDPNGAPRLKLLETLTQDQRLKRFDVAV